MRKSIFIGVLISVLLISCTKTNTSWPGTYTGTVGGSNNINRVVVSQVNSSTLQFQLQISSGSTYYTYVTIQNATVTSASSATINENGLILGYPDTYHFVGTAVLNGNSLIVSGSGTSTTNSSDIKYYYFSGSK